MKITENGADAFCRRGSIRGRDLPHGLQHTLIARLEIGRDEIRLRGKMPVQGGFRNIRFGHDAVDSDGPDALLVKQLLGDFQDVVSHGPPK